MQKSFSSLGLGRRFQIVTFKAKFTPEDEDYDPFITDKLLFDESMQYIILNFVIKSLKRLLEEKKFTKSKAVEEELVRYQEENNPIISFVNNENVELECAVVSDVYLQYKVDCMENGFQSVF
ncbi:hypothetical protein [Bacillus cereus]|uniref:hypothetical protein n=1 Tax=Bacillus cereus TaxID=1396 RepID=UPI0020CB48D2|nr:hypothetical protein [Bacillus cereus]